MEVKSCPLLQLFRTIPYPTPAVRAPSLLWGRLQGQQTHPSKLGPRGEQRFSRCQAARFLQALSIFQGLELRQAKL